MVLPVEQGLGGRTAYLELEDTIILALRRFLSTNRLFLVFSFILHIDFALRFHTSYSRYILAFSQPRIDRERFEVTRRFQGNQQHSRHVPGFYLPILVQSHIATTEIIVEWSLLLLAVHCRPVLGARHRLHLSHLDFPIFGCEFFIFYLLFSPLAARLNSTSSRLELP